MWAICLRLPLQVVLILWAWQSVERIESCIVSTRCLDKNYSDQLMWLSCRGTGPLYALRECFAGGELEIDRVNILSVLSLISCSLIIAMSLKYLSYVMRTDKDGEGEILALITQTGIRTNRHSVHIPLVILLGLFGSALLFGDAMISSAVSVLSAVKGLHLPTESTSLTPLIFPGP